MTPTELAKLTPEEKRVRIAEACGLNVKRCPTHHIRGCCGGDRIPDYLNDLNAMNSAALSLRDRDRLKYAMYHKELERLVAIANCSEDFGIQTSDATATQRADAFLLTINAAQKGEGSE